MIDWQRIHELRAEIGAEDFAEVVSLFLEEADDAVLRLVPGRSAELLEADLHFLKGAALNLGFADFAALCQAGEHAAAQGSTAVDLGHIRACYDASKTAFEAGLDSIASRRAAG